MTKNQALIHAKRCRYSPMLILQTTHTKEFKMTKQVLYVNKSNRLNIHERIKNIGGINSDGSRWRLTQKAAIDRIESGKYSFNVSVHGKVVRVIVASSRHGNKYLKTEADGAGQNSLLSLKENL